MAQYSFNTSNAEENAVTWQVAIVNAQLALQGIPPITNAQYLRQRIINAQLAVLVDAMRQSRRQTLEQKYEDADAATRQAVNAALGYTE